MFTIGTSSAVLRESGLKEGIDALSLAGYDAVEIWMGQFLESEFSSAGLKSYFKEKNMEFRIHADIRDVNLTSVNRGIREESLKQALFTIEEACCLGASVVTMHPGRMSSTKDKPEDFWEMQIEVFNKLASYAEKRGVFIGVENMEKRPKELITEYEGIKRLIKSVNNPALGLTLDIAHYFGVGNIADFVKKIDFPIVNVHVSQANNDKMHLPLYNEWEGMIDYTPVLTALREKHKGCLIIEGYVRGNEAETITKNIKWLRNMIKGING